MSERVDRFVLVETPGSLHPAFRAEAVENALADTVDGRSADDEGTAETVEQQRRKRERR